MKSAVKLKKFLSLSEAENFMNSFNEDVVKREVIPLFVPDVSPVKIVYFVFLEYLVKD